MAGKEMEKKMYVLNSPVLTDWGKYQFRKIERRDVAYILKGIPFISAIGHEPTASLLSRMLRVDIPFNRIQIKMDVGDRAIVFRLLERLPEGKIFTEDELWHVPCEFGMLERLPDVDPEVLPLCPRCGGETFVHPSGLIKCWDASCGWVAKPKPKTAQRGWDW